MSWGVEGGTKKFSIWFRDVADDASEKHAADVKAEGWKSQMVVSGAGGLISAQKGKVAVELVHGKEKKTGVVIAYEVPE